MIAALKALWKAALGLLRQRGSLDWDVNRAVNGAVRETLHGAVGWAVIWAVDDAAGWAVDQAVFSSHWDDPKHHALEDFLEGVDVWGQTPRE